MKKLTISADRRMTVREVAEQLECNPETVKKHIRVLFHELMQERKITYLNEMQVTALLVFCPKQLTT